MSWVKVFRILLILFVFERKMYCASKGNATKVMDAVEELIAAAGFTSESYTVETGDHYLLKLHRIHAKTQSSARNYAPVFFMHGLFATAADFLLTGADNGLPFLLSTLGFDCWLGNSRGNDFSLAHRTLTPSSRQFWNFSFHEIGHHDVPALIDFVLTTTGAPQLFYVAHSQGCTALMVLLATRPAFNAKILEAHLLAPAVFMSNFPHPFVRLFASEFDAFVARTKSYDLISNAQIIRLLEPINALFCQSGSPVLGMCTSLILMVCGRNENGTETDVRVVPVLVRHLAHAVSTKQIHHFVQVYQSGRFQHYSYGSASANRAVYGQANPPVYDLQQAQVPMAIYAGKNDMMVAEKDVERLREVLPNVKRYRVIKNYNHCDFNYGAHSKSVVFNHVIRSIREHY